MVKCAHRVIPKRHLKYVGISDKTAARYRKQLLKFFEYVDLHGHKMPNSMEKLDFLAGEYVNHLYQEMEPYGYAGDFISALRRYYPACRRHVETAGLFFKNWKRGLSLRQALPIPADILCGMAGAAIAEGSPRTAVTLLIGFRGLLRTSELVNLKKNQISIVSCGSLLVISLPDSKGAKRKHITEQVLIHDKNIIAFTRQLVQQLDDEECILPAASEICHWNSGG